jgi:hypothetical protein
MYKTTAVRFEIFPYRFHPYCREGMELARGEGIQRAGISKSERDSERRPLAFFGQRERRNGWRVILQSQIHDPLELNFFLKSSKLASTTEIAPLLGMLL